ncbi:MAG: PAS domain S-box protein [Clostridiaceae bacterium]|nr:PAS domain S-box protein [Clostridiaceae bacterium]
MTKKIFYGIFVASVLTFAACLVLILGVLYNYFDKQLIEDLHTQGHMIAAAVETGSGACLEELGTLDNRLTWVGPDGEVLYDNQADSSAMENHLDREEIAEAMESGQGESERYSETLSQKTVYYAIRLADNSVIRLADTRSTVWNLLFGMIQPLLMILTIAIILSAVLASRISKSIVRPINAINLEAPDVEGNYDEISPLLLKINRQNEQIKHQMEELRRQREEFRLITENMSEGFLVIDRKTELLSYNSAALRLLGSGPVEGTPSVLMLNRSESFRQAVETALAGEHCEHSMTLDGSIYHVIANPVSRDGETAGAVIVILDCTERELRDQMRREFTSNVSHELKTPLTSIYGVSEMIAGGIVKPEDIPSFARNIHAESGRLITLIEDIIKLSQLDENLVPSDPVPVDLFETAASVVKRLRSQADARGIQMELTGGSAIVHGIPNLLDEMIYNLCDNAIKYNKDGGRVRISVENGEHPTVTVSDTGIGIPREHQPRVFERFYRADKSHSKKIGGTGLGLSIVKHAAAYHGAAVSLESTEGEGTTVTVRF